MKTRHTLPLYKALEDLIKQCDEEGVLDLNTKVFMARSLESFCLAAIEKYIAGQKEHGGNLMQRDCFYEMGQEHIDQFWYYMVEKKKGMR